jgi:hypothetical protein
MAMTATNGAEVAKRGEAEGHPAGELPQTGLELHAEQQRAQREDPRERQLQWARRLVVLLIVLAAFSVRSQDLSTPSGYMDETIHVVYGRMFLENDFEYPLDTPLRWSFGWYVWPVMAATAERLSGIAGVRLLGAALGALTALALYGIGRRLFSPAAGLASAFAFAMLAPCVFVSRIATRDCAALFFFAVGFWLYLRAWGEEESGKRKEEGGRAAAAWLGAALAFFLAFLCKYLVAFYFPFLCIVGLAGSPAVRGHFRRSVLYFGVPLGAMCAAYVGLCAEELMHLLRYGQEYEGLRAGAGTWWRTYAAERPEFWVLAGLSIFAWRWQNGTRRRLLALWLGAAVALLFQWTSGADANWWKHVNYAYVFLIPAAMAGLLRLVGRATGQEFFIVSSLGAIVLNVALGWAGGTWRPERFFFWPDAEPLLANLEGKLNRQHRVLVDDSAFRYYLRYAARPGIAHQSLITDPFHIAYPYEDAWPNLRVGAAGYNRAVRDGWFDYVVLDGGISESAHLMALAIAPVLPQRYARRLSMPEPVRGGRYEIWERVNPPVRPPTELATRIEIDWPRSGEMVRAEGIRSALRGRASSRAAAALAGAYVTVDVFTNRWYAQGGAGGRGARFAVAADGSFSAPVYLGGQDELQCNHLIRARLHAASGRILATSVSHTVGRLNADGSLPACAP